MFYRTGVFNKVVWSDSTSTTSNERILQRVTSDFLQQATSSTSNKQILPRVTSDFLQRATFATSNEQILLRLTSDFTTSNEQRVKSYAYNSNLLLTTKLLGKQNQFWF